MLLSPERATSILVPVLQPCTVLVESISGAIGCDYQPTTNQLIFVEDAGNVSLLHLFRPLAGVASKGTMLLDDTATFDFETGRLGRRNAGGDVSWQSDGRGKGRIEPIGAAKLAYVGAVGFDELTSAALQAMHYDEEPLGNDGSAQALHGGIVFAVLTNGGHYSKVEILALGNALRIHWETFELASRCQVLGAGYHDPADVIVHPDGVTAFVTERVGNVVRVDLTNAARSNAETLVSGLERPHQLQFDRTFAHVYVVESGISGRLLKINTSTGALETVAEGLEHAAGLVVSDDDRCAYVSEETAAGGRIRKFLITEGLSGGAPVAVGLTAPYMMAWADATRERIVLCERDPANCLAVVDVRHQNAVVRPAIQLGSRPSAVVPLRLGRVVITCESEIDQAELGMPTSGGPFVKGVGNVRLDQIVDGFADTSADPSYAFQARREPFCGTLALRINHAAAFREGARSYRVLVDGVPVDATWDDARWNPTTSEYEPQKVSPEGDIGYPVRDPAEAPLWAGTDVAVRIDSRRYENGRHTIDVQFRSVHGALVPIGTSCIVRLENRPAVPSGETPSVYTARLLREEFRIDPQPRVDQLHSAGTAYDAGELQRDLLRLIAVDAGASPSSDNPIGQLVSGPLPECWPILVPIGRNAWALLVLDDRIEPRATTVEVSRLHRFIELLPEEIVADILPAASKGALLSMIEEVSQSDLLPPLAIVAARRPRMVLTLATGGELTCGDEFVTVGAPVVRDGVLGFITVAHALSDTGASYQRNGGEYPSHKGKVDRTWDTAWFPLLIDDDFRYPAWVNQPTVSHDAPRRDQRCRFSGATTTDRFTAVDSIDPLIPKLHKKFLARVYTPPCTEEGDSGAILWAADEGRPIGAALGMAQGRTAEGEEIGFSVWIWIPGILGALNGVLATMEDLAKVNARLKKPREEEEEQ
jgi:hypothetical protein